MSLGVSKMRTYSKNKRMRYTGSFSKAALLFITQAPAKVKNCWIYLDGFRRELLVYFVDALDEFR